MLQGPENGWKRYYYRRNLLQAAAQVAATASAAKFDEWATREAVGPDPDFADAGAVVAALAAARRRVVIAFLDAHDDVITAAVRAQATAAGDRRYPGVRALAAAYDDWASVRRSAAAFSAVMAVAGDAETTMWARHGESVPAPLLAAA